ncbi:MAG TPA: transcriptional repressor [Longimicrobium sp.]|nr:transcriptional repressor [Longimicrobium sp.]
MTRNEQGKRPLGQRRTTQRQVIAEVIRQARGPLSIAEILERATLRVPGLGVATVYRTVRLLEEAGDVQGVNLPGADTRYEPTGRGHHHHFQCRVCDGVYDIHVCPVKVGLDSIGDGFQVEAHDVTLYGVCGSCAA